MRLRRGLLPSRWSIKFSSFSAPSPLPPSGRYYIVDRTLERGLKRLAGCHPDCCRSPRKAIWQLDHRSERAAKIADKRKQLALRARQAARLLGRNDGDGAYGTKHGHAQIAQRHARERRLGLSANPEHAGATKKTNEIARDGQSERRKRSGYPPLSQIGKIVSQNVKKKQIDTCTVVSLKRTQIHWNEAYESLG